MHIQKLDGTCNYHQQIQLRHSVKFIEARMTRYVMNRRALEKTMCIGIFLPLKIIMKIYKYLLYTNDIKGKILLKTLH